MKNNNTNNDHGARPKASVAGAQFLQIEPPQLSDLDLISVSGGSPTGEDCPTSKCWPH